MLFNLLIIICPPVAIGYFSWIMFFRSAPSDTQKTLANRRIIGCIAIPAWLVYGYWVVIHF